MPEVSGVSDAVLRKLAEVGNSALNEKPQVPSQCNACKTALSIAPLAFHSAPSHAGSYSMQFFIGLVCESCGLTKFYKAAPLVGKAKLQAILEAK